MIFMYNLHRKVIVYLSLMNIRLRHTQLHVIIIL